MISAQCPACIARVEITAEPEIGDRLTCLACGTTVEIIWLYPLVLDFLEEEILANHTTQPSGQETSLL